MMFSTGDCSKKPLLTGSGEPMGHADGSSASLACAQPSEAGQATSFAPGMSEALCSCVEQKQKADEAQA